MAAMTEDELRAALLLKLDEPSSVSADGVSVSNRSLSEVMAAYERLRRPERRSWTQRIQKLVPPGTQ